MTDRLPQLKPLTLIRVLERLGFLVRRQTGSHMIMRHPISNRTVSIPIHAGDIKRGLLFGILKQSGIDRDDFLSQL